MITTRQPNIQVLIVSEDPLARAGLASLLETSPVCTVVGTLSLTEADADAIDALSPSIVVCDLGWVAHAAEEHLSDIVDAGYKVVVLATDTEQAAVVWSVGARAIINRAANLHTIESVLLAASNGLAVVDESFVGYQSGPAPRAPVNGTDVGLTRRENEVLSALGRGASNKTIAFDLGISEHTVKFHVNSIMGKLGAQSRTEAVVMATRNGMLPL